MQTPHLSRLLMAAAVSVLSTVAWAQTVTPEYFPLQTGNSWLFRQTGTDPNAEATDRSITVGAKESIRGRDYFNVRYFDRTITLRAEADGTVVAFNRTSGMEEPWLKLGLPVGSSFESHIDQCTQAGRIESRDANVTTPIGEFPDAVHVSFQGNCADAGIKEQYYVAGIGPVSHTEASFAGPRKYELAYYRVGSSNLTSDNISFTVGLDARVYRVGGTMGVRLTARSTDPQPVKLHFPTGQSYELKIFDASGNLVYTWSAGKAFPAIVRDEQFGPGELSYGFSVPLNGTGLPPGQYKAQAYIPTAPVMFLGEVPFEISEFLP